MLMSVQPIIWQQHKGRQTGSRGSAVVQTSEWINDSWYQTETADHLSFSRSAVCGVYREMSEHPVSGSFMGENVLFIRASQRRIARLLQADSN